MSGSVHGAIRVAFWMGPALFAAALGLGEAGWAPGGLGPAALVVAGAAAWMATWWISEAVPIAATSLLPLLLFPLFSVAGVKEVARPYMHPIILLLMAGFMAALAIERWGLHRRVALKILRAIGTSPRRLVLGMMVACAVCSMWISNTATTLMLLPVALALVTRAEEAQAEGRASAGEVRAFAVALLLGIAYSASVGGLGTPIGTPPNLVMLGVYERSFPDAPPIAFVDWMMFGVPLVVVMVGLIWVYLTRIAHPVPDALELGSSELMDRELEALGPTTRDERAVGLVFGAMALLWITRRMSLGGGEVIGWSPLLGLDGFVDDSTVAVLGAIALFALPSRTRPGERLLDWPTAKRIPWEVVLLFGGGVSLASGFKVSGLSAGIAEGLAGLAGLPWVLLIGSIVLVVIFLTEVTSNTATSTILMPVLAAFSTAADLDPASVMVPAVLAASCAFMLPVATAPNAIVYGSERIRIATMARAGLWLNLIGTVVLTAWALVIG